MKSSLLAFAGALLLAVTANVAQADEAYTITIKDHKFDPATVEIPADQKVMLKVVNADATPEEFESQDFNREKIIKGNSEAMISVGPLRPGSYNFFGEFNPDTAQGTLVVK